MGFSILDLPTELLVIIVSYVSSRDKVRLLYVSQRLRIVSETPSLWREFVWDYYDTREEFCVIGVLKRCGEHIKQLAFPGYLTPKLDEMLKYCSNARHVSLPAVMTFSPDRLAQLGEAIHHMRHLHTLDISWDITSIKPVLLIGSNLKELTLYSNEEKVFPLTLWVDEWVGVGFKPSILNITLHCRIVYTEFLSEELTENWQQWNLKVPAGHSACFKVYAHFKLSLNLSPVLPVFQLQFGQKPIFPFVQTGLQGLHCLHLTDCCKDGKTMYKATNLSLPLDFPQSNSTLHVTNLHFLTHFNVAGLESDPINVSYYFFLPYHLEQLAIECPNLQQLILRGCHECLKNLQGLRTIASHCHDLQGLDVSGISVTELESQIQLWEILSNIKLTHLALDFCVISPIVGGGKEEKLICLFEKCFSLLAIEYGYLLCGARSCKHCHPKAPINDCLLLSRFPSLLYCKVLKRHSPPIQDIINNCKNLKCCRIRSVTSKPLPLSPIHNVKLQQLYIKSSDLTIPDTFMKSISAHGGLLHVFLSVASVTVVGISVLIQNSPNLITFQLFPPVKICHRDGRKLLKSELLKFKLSLKQRFYQHKLFHVGGCRLFHQDHASMRAAFLEQTDLGIGMLWNE